MEAAVNGTADAWRERIAAHGDSGQSIRAWCRENNCHEHSFYWWRSRLGLSPQSVTKRPRRPARAIKFAEVVVDRAASESVCPRLNGGRELVLPASMPVEQLAKLIHAVEAQV